MIGLVNFGSGATFFIYGIFFLFFIDFITGLSPATATQAITPDQKLTFIFLGIVFIISSVYLIITGIGLWKYKDYGRIMFLILLYIYAFWIVSTAIMVLIGTLFAGTALAVLLKNSLLTGGLFGLGAVALILLLYMGTVIYWLIYLFQKQKDFVALFKGQK